MLGSSAVVHHLRSARGKSEGISTQQEIFDRQVEFLVEAGLGNEGELRRLTEFAPKTGKFLVMPSRPNSINLRELMGLVVVDGVHGSVGFGAEYVSNEISVPDGPYIILDIEDGRGRLNVAPAKSKWEFAERERRFGLTVFEGIIYAAIHPEVLVHHGLDLVGSRFSVSASPYLSLDDSTPTLYFCGENVADPEWGAPSCLGRKGLTG